MQKSQKNDEYLKIKEKIKKILILIKPSVRPMSFALGFSLKKKGCNHYESNHSYVQ